MRCVSGCYPLADKEGDVVGAFGVSGGAVEQDWEVAQVGVSRWEEIRGE
ncbi:heme-binding protein [Natronococcus jeotgali]|nr:heme-binding protein [Natronococcus jeotgali]